MRSSLLIAVFLSLFALALASWSKEDQEIFRIRDELELAEGEGLSFYDFLKIPQGPRASLDDISKAYRKISVKNHPDKHRPVPGLSKSAAAESHRLASERFARLGIIAAILRGPERERYDHFLKNGFPKWRGTGYYYARLRPGLGTVLVGLVLFANAAHYAIMVMNANRHRAHVAKLMREAQTAAWGGNAALYDVVEEPKEEKGEEEPIPRNRKERRAALKANERAPTPPIRAVAAPGEKGPQRRKVYLPSGQQFIVDATGKVFLLDGRGEDQEEIEVHMGLAESASVRNTFLFKVPAFFWRITAGRVLGKKEDVEEDSEDSEEDAPRKKGAPKKVDGTVGGARRRVKEKRQKK